MFEILDSMIATVTVVLVISLLVQAIQQIVKQLLNMKAKYMERELFALFAHVEYKPRLVPIKLQFQQLAKQHPHVKELVDTIARRLSGVGYNDIALLEGMRKEEFFDIAADVFDTGDLETTDMKTLSLPEQQAVKEKIAFLQQARADVERWYDATMKSFQDHYERRMKFWAFVLSAIVVVWLNANLFEIYREFSTNKVLRETAVRLGERFASTPRDSLIVMSTPSGEQVPTYIADSAAFALIGSHIKRIDSLVNAQSFTMMRWNSPTGTLLPTSVATLWEAITRNFFGWIAMTLLVGLGAPFWYDVLRTLVGVKERLRARSSGGSSDEPARVVHQSAVVTPPTQPPPAMG